ncbi:MAG: maleylacetoacetate isomerase [Comamonas sp.]
MILHSFWLSLATYRVRIALNLKRVAFEERTHDLLQGEQHAAAFRAVNPAGAVPALEGATPEPLTQSLAILEWLEETYPTPALLPQGAAARARVRALAALIGCDVHPINNRRILMRLRQQFGADEAAVNAWCATWISAGFDAFEALLAQDSQRGDFCFGGAPTLADAYLVPQVESARRFGVDMGAWPLISAVDAACARLPAFARAAPLAQPDAAG